MSDDLYSVRTSGKLKLKGEKDGGSSKKKAKKAKKRKHDDDRDDLEGQGESSGGSSRQERKKAKALAKRDVEDHGGWWPVKDFKHVTGPVAIEYKGCYVKTLDDGGFTLGPPKDQGQGPDPEEVLLAVKVTEDKVAFKSGYNKYLKVEPADGSIRGISDAVGVFEQFEPVFQDGQMALLAANSKFLSIGDQDEIVCQKATAGETEMIRIRSNGEREEDKKVAIPEEEQGKIGQVELNYVKKFQKFQDHKIKLCNDDRESLLQAKREGALHEALLDRRSKMKADRYCK